MKIRQGNSTPKFSRKGSQVSPDPSRANNLNSEIITDTCSNNNSKSVHYKVLNSSYTQKQNNLYKDEEKLQRNFKSIGIYKLKQKQEVQRQLVIIQQIPKQNTEPQPKQNSIKFSYIPLQSLNTSQSLPTVRKKITYCALQTKRNDQTDSNISKTSKKSDNISLNQTFHISQSQRQQTYQKNKILQEIDHLKSININLLNDVNRYKKNSQVFQRECLRKNIQIQRFQKIVKQYESKKQEFRKIEECIKKIQVQLKIKSQENKELNRIIQQKQKQIQNMKKQYLQCMPQTKYHEKYSSRSVSISQFSNSSSSIHRISTFRPKIQQNQQKCNRYIQTQNSKIQLVLKQNQLLTVGIKNKQKTIKMLQMDVKILNQKARQLQKVSNKLAEEQKLIENLNEKLIRQTAAKLANKYRYF